MIESTAAVTNDGDDASLVEWTMVTNTSSLEDASPPSSSSSSSSSSSLWILFCDYALSSWSDRMWAFALPVLFVEKLQRDQSASAGSLLLLPASMYALLSQIACVLFGSAVGAWIDVTDRRRVVSVLLTLQNGCVVAAAFLFAYMTREVDDESASDWRTSTEFWLLFGLLTLFGSIAALASLGQSVALKKDWVVVLACRDTARLAKINATMRGIDLACDITAPMLFSVVLTSTDATSTLVFVALWNVVSYFPELFLLLSMYNMNPALQSRKLDDSALPSAADAPAAPMPSFVERWRIYASQPVLLSSLSLVLLYITALQPGFLLMSYLKSQRVDDIALASFRGFAAVSGLLSTVVVPLLLSRGVRVETLALASVSLQFLCLLPTLATVLVPDAPPVIFMACVAASRVALYSFDLCVTQIMQSGVSEPVRGVVNAAEGSLTNLASMVGYSLGIISPDPADFGNLVVVSLLAIATSVVCSALHWRNARDRAQLLRLSKV